VAYSSEGWRKTRRGLTDLLRLEPSGFLREQISRDFIGKRIEVDEVRIETVCSADEELLGSRAAGHGVHQPTLLSGLRRCVEATARLARFDDDHGAAQAADNPIARHQVLSTWWCAGVQFRQQRAAIDDLLGQFGVLSRMDEANSGAKNGQRPPRFERAAMSGRVDAERQPAHDRQSA